MTGIGREQHGPHNAAADVGAGNVGTGSATYGQAANAHHGLHLPHDLHLDELLGAVAKSLGKSLDLAGRGYCCTCNPMEDAGSVALTPARTTTPPSAQSSAIISTKIPANATQKQSSEEQLHENLSGK